MLSQIIKRSTSSIVPYLFRTFLDRFPDDSELHAASRILLQEVLRSATDDWERSLNEASENQRPGNGVQTLVGMLNVFGQHLFNDDPEFASVRI